MFPIRVIFLPFESLFRQFYKPLDLDDSYDNVGDAPKGMTRLGLSGKRLLAWLVNLPVMIVKAPFAMMRGLVTGSRSEILFILPAFLMFLFFGFVFYKVFADQNDIERRYRKGAFLAMQDNDFNRARTFYTRLFETIDINEGDQLNWAIVLANTNDEERANQILDKLAPDDQPGYAPVHKMKALTLSGEVGRSRDPKMLTKLRHHLENCRDDSPAISQAWAQFYLEIGDEDSAIRYLRESSKLKPEFNIAIANIYNRRGATEQRDAALRTAERTYRELLNENPLDVNKRLALATTLARQKKFEEAEKTLLTGMRQQQGNPSQTMRLAIADYFVLRHDLSAKDKESFTKQFEYLQKAISFEPNYPAIYQRLATLYQRASETGDAKEVKEQLMDLVTGDTPSPMAHFALSNVLWSEGQKDDAEWHLEQAYKLDKNFVVVINNLAWMLAHREEDPDLERAMELVNVALEAAPKDPRFMDTHATILMLENKFEEAIPIFQKAIPYTALSKPIHEKLAKCYTEIGKPELAKLHAKRAQSTKTKN